MPPIPVRITRPRDDAAAVGGDCDDDGSGGCLEAFINVTMYRRSSHIVGAIVVYLVTRCHCKYLLHLPLLLRKGVPQLGRELPLPARLERQLDDVPAMTGRAETTT